MAELNRPSPVKLLIGAIFASEGILIKARVMLERKFGPLDYRSPIMPFDYTGYYSREMGMQLKRQFFSFKKLINPQDLAAIKVYTNRLEKRFSRRQDNLARKMVRRINLDPGYISRAKLVLATCKNYAHRIYLNKGIYAEVTLHFQDGTFVPRPWTYPDYRTQSYIREFNTIRRLYLKQLPN